MLEEESRSWCSVSHLHYLGGRLHVEMEVELAGMPGPGHVILSFLQVKIPLVEPDAIKFCHIIKIFPVYIIIIHLVMVMGQLTYH